MIRNTQIQATVNHHSIHTPKLAKIKISDEAEDWCAHETMNLLSTAGWYLYYTATLKVI